MQEVNMSEADILKLEIKGLKEKVLSLEVDKIKLIDLNKELTLENTKLIDPDFELMGIQNNLPKLVEEYHAEKMNRWWYKLFNTLGI